MCPIKDERTRFEFMYRGGRSSGETRGASRFGWIAILAYRIIEAHGADTEPARPTPYPDGYDDLVFDPVTGWSQTIIVDGKLPEWLRDDDLCISHMSLHAFGWPARKWGDDELAIRVRRREPKRETVRCSIMFDSISPVAATIDLIDGKPDLSTLKIAEDAL